MKNEVSNRLPNWAAISLTIIVGFAVFFITRHYAPAPKPETVIKTEIRTVTQKRDSIITVIKNNSAAGSKKGDSLVNLLKHEPWKLSNQDMKDSTVVNFLKNYRYE